MSSRTLSPPDEPGSSSQSTLQPTSSEIRIQTPEAPASLDDLLKFSHNPALSHLIQPSSTLKGASPHDQRRRNGFHLWQTESEDARNARLREVVQAAEAQANSPRTLTDGIRDEVRSATNWIGSRQMFSLYRRFRLPEGEDGVGGDAFAALHQPRLSRLGLIILTLSLAGAQLAWTLELAYGTPYLLSLGLSEQSTSLVWLAGPLSGLIAQPMVGSLSDHSTSSFRRRKYMIISAALLTISTITLAYSVPISTALVDLYGGGLANWDPHRHQLVHSTTQAISVLAFWILDFALNGLQAASRALILDTAPSEQQTIANAWQGRMTHAGNVVGTTYVLRIAEYEKDLKRQRRHRDDAFSFAALYREGGEGSGDDGGHGSSDRDAERGSFAMLMFAVVSLISAALLPYLALAGEKSHDIRKPSPTSPSSTEEEDPLTPPILLNTESHPHSSRQHDPEYSEKLSRAKRIARGLTQGLTLRTFWTLASIAFAALMLVGTAWASTVYEATVVIALVGVPWSIAAWAPFAMVGEFVREAEDGTSPFEFEDDHWSPERIRARAVDEGLRRGRQSVRGSVSRVVVDEDEHLGGGVVNSNGETITSPNESAFDPAVGRRGFKYIDAPQQRGMSSQYRSTSGKGEQVARERIRASLADCAPLPRALTRTDSDDADSIDGLRHSDLHSAHHAHDNQGTGGAGTILGIHNLAIVAPQFIVAIIASLIFSAVHSSHNGIHLVLGNPIAGLKTVGVGTTAFALARDEGREGRGGKSGHPAEGTIWVLRFGGAMALFAALATRFVPLTLSERRRRYAGHERREDDEEAIEDETVVD
ncbi:related to General alpha-glucoside permease [Ustilago bromivora]|uniref:Related to General alpha-glucoside permease n=1 Tax=Ustilago bromivora TaxID=307758 RepID=A0A8H8TRL3_9BASI|nr:related to General alpha-glucoside permease [Ustilago bromivora]